MVVRLGQETTVETPEIYIEPILVSDLPQVMELKIPESVEESTDDNLVPLIAAGAILLLLIVT